MKIRPEKKNWDFILRSKSVETSTDLGFEAVSSIEKYEVSGIVEDADGEPVSGVNLGVYRRGYTTTNSEGEYSFAGLRGEVDITPESEGYSFKPGSVKVYGPEKMPTLKRQINN